MTTSLTIREIDPAEYAFFSELVVGVYSRLEGFPSPVEHPDYYRTLANIGSLNDQEHTTVLVAEKSQGEIAGGIVYYDDMSVYKARGKAPLEKRTSGIRLLCVAPEFTRMGIGRALACECIRLANVSGNRQVILHSTEAMKVSWHLYQNLGFNRSPELDFVDNGYSVLGFSLKLTG